MNVGMASDLSQNEVLDLFSQKAISADEVIEVYRNMRVEKVKKS